jgi:hypothetical protein
LLSAFALTAGSVSRFGPIVPVAFAGANVWHEAQPLEANTAFPEAALPPLGVVPVLVEPVVGVEVDVEAEDVDPTVTVCTTTDGPLPSDV